MSSLLDQTLELVETRERARFKKAEQELLTTLRFRAPLLTGDTIARTDSQREDTQGFTDWSVEMVSATKQARYTDEGTGIFGPLQTPIVPKVAKWLHWIDEQTGQDVFAKSSKGSGKHKGWFSKTVLLWAELLGRS